MPRITSGIRNKLDVETHAEGYYGPQLPAVNVRVRSTIRQAIKLPLCLGGSRPANQPDAPWEWEYTADGFTYDWIEEQSDDYTSDLFWDICNRGHEDIADFAKEVFGKHVKCFGAGRSGGWVVVEGLPDIESWDAIMLSKWRKFAAYARAQAADVPYQMTVVLYDKYQRDLEDAENERTKEDESHEETLA